MKLREPSLGVFRANLEAFGPEFAKLLAENPERPTAIDDDIRVEGLKNPTYLVIVGFSTKKVLEAAKKSNKFISNVLIIEPDLGKFHQTLRREYVADFATSENVDLLIGIPPEEMLSHIYKIFTQSDATNGPRAGRCQAPEIVVDPFAYPPVDGKPHPVAEQITKIVMDTSKQVFLSMGCGSDSFFRWEQLVRNEKNLAGTYRVAPLYGKFEDTPVIVVGAGPSMKEFIDAYHEHDLGNRSLIIACDASLHKLLAHGVRPHMVTRCERKLTTIFKGITKKETNGIFYAAYPWCPPEYFDLFDDSFMLFRDNGVCKWSGYDPGSVNGGVSSANAGLELAFLLGAKEIVLTGVDLCFLEGKSHVEGTEVEFDIEKSRSKWTEIAGNSGKRVTTIPVWNRCLNEYCGTLLKYKGTGARVFNTSLHGAKIEGTEVTPWSEVGARVAHRSSSQGRPLDRIRSYLEKHPVGYETKLSEKKTTAVKYLKDVRHELGKLFASVDDYMLIARREEEKAISQLKSFSDPGEFFSNVAALKKSLVGAYQEPARLIDVFKRNHFSNIDLCQIILDTIQLDYFTAENRQSGLKNLVELEHDRLRQYVAINVGFLRQVDHYAQRFIDLFEKGPDQTVDYSKILGEDA